MRTYVGFTMASAMLALLCSGCMVPKEKYDEALAACRRANEAQNETQERLRAARAENDQLKSELDQSRASLAFKQAEVDRLENQNATLASDLAKLQELYKRSQQGEVPMPVGPIVLLPAPVDQALRQFAAENPELVEYLPEYGMVKFKSDFTFEKGEDQLSASAITALNKLTVILNSEAARKFNLYVAGHTDDIPIKKPDTLRRHPTNWYLSVHRSVEVQKQLVKGGLTPSRIGVMGFGEYHPIAPNAPGQKGNQLNRRVEIWVVPPDRFLTSSNVQASSAVSVEENTGK